MIARRTLSSLQVLSTVRRIIFSFAIAVIASLSLAPALQAQATTGTLAGTITANDGSALPGVTIEAVHVPTGTRYQSVSGETGRYVIPNVRVGGPYRVSAILEGFKTVEVTKDQVALGTTTEVGVTLQLSTVSESIVVTATADDIINPNRTGSSSAVSTDQIESLPTINRSLQDFARTNPYFAVDQSDSAALRISVAGKNNRYNTIQIDGAVNNDLFGLADTGTPGGQTDAQPISLDAIQQLQLVVSPYDVRQGGFTGGGINAVTRSGTNEWQGSLFGSARDQELVGDGPFNRPISNFNQEQFGFRLGGPVVRDNLFFFINAELNRREQPTGVSADGSTGTVFSGSADAVLVRESLIRRFGYDPGSLGDIGSQTDSDSAFARLDWNVNNNNQLTVRHNYLDAIKDVVGARSTARFTYPSAFYVQADETNSSVLQLNSVLNASAFNEARIGYQTIRDKRAVPVIFPTIEIGGTGPRNGAITAGTERFSGANVLDQDALEITDDFTLIKGGHTITLGTHNEIFEFSNLFLSEFYGYYYFPTIAAFEAGLANEYSIGFANGADPRRATGFEVRQYGLYASDQWRMNDKLSLTLGIRGDKPDFIDSPSFNPAVQTALGFNTSSTPSDDIVVSPRIGFNWDPQGNGKQQVRGGVGIFAGRTPYVWISNAFGGTGVESTNLTQQCLAPPCQVVGGVRVPTIPFNPDPFNQPRAGVGATPSVDLLDPNFEFPRVLRSTLGYDRDLFFGVRGTAEVVYTQTQEDVFYLNVNRVQTGNDVFDGRPTYRGRITENTPTGPQFLNAIYLTNTSEGSELSASVQFNRSVSRGLTLQASYSYMDAESAFDATSSRAVSNFQFRVTEGDIFKEDLSTSTFEIEHRFVFGPSLSFATGPLDHSVAMFYNVQSGRPYSLLTGGDPNSDGFTTNDLLFVPGSADSVVIQNAAGAVIPYEVFAAFLERAGVNPTLGGFVERNSLNEPWSRILDFHYDIEIPVSAVRTQLSFDILNLLNLFDEEYGVIEFVSFQTNTPVRRICGAGASNANPCPNTGGKAIYRENFTGALNPGSQFATADLRSRWQAKVGLRFSF